MRRHRRPPCRRRRAPGRDPGAGGGAARDGGGVPGRSCRPRSAASHSLGLIAGDGHGHRLRLHDRLPAPPPWRCASPEAGGGGRSASSSLRPVDAALASGIAGAHPGGRRDPGGGGRRRGDATAVRRRPVAHQESAYRGDDHPGRPHGQPADQPVQRRCAAAEPCRGRRSGQAGGWPAADVADDDAQQPDPRRPARQAGADRGCGEPADADPVAAIPIGAGDGGRSAHGRAHHGRRA